MSDFEQRDLSEFSDVLAKEIEIEHVTALEFEFEGFVIRRERNHWEIQFEDAEGENGIVIEREEFKDGKLEFDIGDQKMVLTLEDFDRVDKFAHDNKLI